MIMLARRRVACLATIGSLLLGLTGCGGGVPTTGESIKAGSNTAAKQKTMLEGYLQKKGVKGQPKLKGSEP
jgi:hypothetical protein